MEALRLELEPFMHIYDGKGDRAPGPGAGLRDPGPKPGTLAPSFMPRAGPDGL